MFLLRLLLGFGSFDKQTIAIKTQEEEGSFDATGSRFWFVADLKHLRNARIDYLLGLFIQPWKELSDWLISKQLENLPTQGLLLCDCFVY